MNINKGYKVELQPNNKQKTLFNKCAGISRYAYNWGIEQKEIVYRFNQMPMERVKYPTAIDLHKELNILKKGKLSWMYEVSKYVPQVALQDLDDAYKIFFNGISKYPKRKKKKDNKKFRMYDITKITDKTIKLPKIGVVKFKEYGYIPTGVKIISATVSKKVGRWFVSVQVEEDIEIPENNGEIIGVDLCCGNKMAHCSNNVIFNNPNSYRKVERKKKRIQKEVSRKKKGSNNKKKVLRKLGKLEYRIANIRKDAQHKCTTELTKTKSVIVIEDLDVNSMLQNNKKDIKKGISNVGMGEIRRQLEYKSIWYGSQIIVADRFYPSSKMCSNCGNINHDLELSDRVFECPKCNFSIDRDLNASINLKTVAISSLETDINDCLKQEVSGDLTPVLVNDSVNEYQR